jgi:hypothetical protein
MANDFRSQINAAHSASMRNAMSMMGGGSTFDAISSGAIGSGMDKRQQAIDKARAWSDQGISAFSGMGDAMTGMNAQAMGTGIQLKTADAVHKAQMEAARAQQGSSTLGNIIGTAASIGGMFLCERRLKEDIQPLPANAWEVVRDLPLYSFRYKAAPGPVVYGPMVDEVEHLDPSLVRPSLLPDDEQGPIRGFDVMRHQAYESAALQQALQRIEQLEERLAKVESPRHPVPLALVEAV